MSRLRRVAPSGRYFFVTRNLLRTWAVLNEVDSEILARVRQVLVGFSGGRLCECG